MNADDEQGDRLTEDSTATARFRDRFLRTEVSSGYSGWMHFYTVSTITLVVIGACIYLIRDVTWLELLTVPATFIYANLAEYLGHRGPMHRRTKGLAPVFLHTTVHHRFFTHAEFGYRSSRDFYAVLLPPAIVAFFFGGFALPGGLLIGWLLTPNCAYLFVATAAAYFLSYEWLHFCYHASEASWPYRFRGIRLLQRHHRVHHDQGLMTEYNFNITFPIFDWLFGTIRRR